MSKAKSPNGWTLKQGLAAQYAAQAGLDPELGAQAGEAAWDVLRATREAVDEPNLQRQAKLAKKAFRRLNSAGLSRHRELVDQVIGVLNSLVHSDTRASVNPRTNLQEFAACEISEQDCGPGSGRDGNAPGPIEEITVYGSVGGGSSFQPGVPTLGLGAFSGNSAGGVVGADVSGSDTSTLGQIIPPNDEPTTGTVPMPTVGSYVDLSDGLDSVHRNLELMPDNVLNWALDESFNNTVGWLKSPGGNALLFGNPLGGRNMWMQEWQQNWRDHNTLLGERDRRIEEGIWSLD